MRVTLLRRIAQAAGVLVAALTFTGTAQASPCAINCLRAGDHTVVTLSGGLLRTYLVHVPASYTGNAAVPLMLDLHGFSSNADEERRVSGHLQESDKRGFIAVWPQGIALSWNGNGCCFLGDALNVDDVSFLRGVIGAVKGRANIDTNRVFVTGISNGGGMAQRMACEAADIVRAVAAVSFPLNSNTCRPAKPIGVTEIAGTADGTISYYGNPSSIPPLPNDTLGIPLGVQGARESLAAWKIINGCTDDLTRIQLPADSRHEEYGTCSGGVRTGLVTLVGAPHVLYNGYRGPLGVSEPVSVPIDVAEYIWDHVFNL